jgi:signal transduction histidine kinase
VDGALRASAPVSTVNNRTRNAILVMLAIGVGAVGLSALIAIYQSRRLVRPLQNLSRAAAQLGDGDFTVRSEPSGIPEVDAVSMALDTTATRLDRMLTRERSFSEDASHQLRTPLTGLRVNLEAARLDPNADHNAAFDAALGEVDRLERTIDDLLALAREAPADRTELDVSAVLAEIEGEWRARFAAVGRPLQVTVEARLARVTVSPRALRQIIDVLLDNALRYGTGTVSVGARAAPVGIAIEIGNEGPGITGDPERIFERRGEGSTGHGIGLALARSLAEAEGARLRLEHAGPHPVFAVFLPAVPVSDEE